MTPRGTDWSLAALVALMLATGVMSLFSGEQRDGWVFAVHGVGGAALGIVVGWKLRRVWRRLTRPWRAGRAAVAGLAVTLLVAAALASGFAWALGGNLSLVGYNLLNWHMALGTTLAALVLAHALLRAKPIRSRDVVGRRQLLASAGVLAAGLAVWQLLRPLSSLFGWRGDERRFTGSYEAASFEGNAFPATSWVADDPRPLDPDAWRLWVDGLVDRPRSATLGELRAMGPFELEATLDCTGGFYSTQRWRGARLGALLDRAGVAAEASHVRVHSHTGYRWSFPLAEARELLLATHVGAEELSHSHGAPLRLIAPGRRGFQWVKWVVRVEVAGEPDAGALPATVWSSFTAEGRGVA